MFKKGELTRVLRGAPASKAAQLGLFMQYRGLIAAGASPKIRDTGMRILSGTDDDGILLFIFAVLGFRSKYCVDIGAGDGINSNCANLVTNWGFIGLLLDGNPRNVERGRAFFSEHPDTTLYPPQFREKMITAENINQILETECVPTDIDLLSIDIDGNDFWVWKTIDRIVPRVVIIETHIEFGTRNIVVPYDPMYCYPGKHPQYHGASPTAMIELGRSKGYRLIGTNNYGFNFIFVHNSEDKVELPEISVQEALRHRRNAERAALFKEVEDFKYLSFEKGLLKDYDSSGHGYKS